MYQYKWFVPHNHSDWYYYQPRNKIEFKKSKNLIYKTLDPHLKNIFKFASDKGYITLPSCEGHFHTDADIKNKYNSVIKDFIKITSDKLPLKDIESNEDYHYSNVNYNLPWQSFEDFKKDITDNMNIGYFGIVDPKGINNINLDHIKFEIENIKNNKLLHISVYNKDKKDISKNWQEVLDILKNKLL